MKQNQLIRQLQQQKRLTLLVPAVVIGSFFLSACQRTPSAPASAGTSPTQSSDKSGDITKSGTLTQAGGKFFLQSPGGTPTAVDSYTVQLSGYVNKRVTVTGQYSGDVLFVSSVQ